MNFFPFSSQFRGLYTVCVCFFSLDINKQPCLSKIHAKLVTKHSINSIHFQFNQFFSSILSHICILLLQFVLRQTISRRNINENKKKKHVNEDKKKERYAKNISAEVTWIRWTKFSNHIEFAWILQNCLGWSVWVTQTQSHSNSLRFRMEINFNCFSIWQKCN